MTLTKTNRIQIIQNDCTPNGLRTVRLHTFIMPDTEKRKRQNIDIEEVTNKDRSIEDVARDYLIACEKAANRIERDTSQESEELMGLRNHRIKINDFERKYVGREEIEYGEPEPMQEVEFLYEYEGYSIYGAYARVELETDNQLVSATIVCPSTTNGFPQSAPTIKTFDWKIALGFLEKRVGYWDDKWENNWSWRWFFDTKNKKWRFVCIVEDAVVPFSAKKDGIVSKPISDENIDRQKHARNKLSTLEMIEYPEVVDCVIDIFDSEDPIIAEI